MAMLRGLPIELYNITRISLLPRLVSSTTTTTTTRTSSRRGLSTNSNNKHPYVTTPIFYVNASPHIGHLHSILLADVYSRYYDLKGDFNQPSLLCTGTDEHGLKISRAASSSGITEIELCNKFSLKFKELANRANVDYDVFIRTTEERHKEAVECVWQELNNKGYIYKSNYAGWYSVSDETYYSETVVHSVTNLTTGVSQMESIETGSTVEWMEEENYKFKLSSFKSRLTEWLSSNPSVLQPPSRTSILLAALSHPTSTDLQDLSISRPSSRLTWGIRVPGDEDHTVYVWIDALVNYLTAAGYPWKGGEAYKEGEVWPPELMIVGKDIVRFHALYLPAILMALDLPLPKHILAHGHWTMGKLKMSKSRGNVADPFVAMDLWGTDALRGFLMRQGGNSAIDSDYSENEIELFYKKDLLGTLGNTLARSMTKKMMGKLSSPDLIGINPDQVEEGDEAILKALNELPALFNNHMQTFSPSLALSVLFSTLRLSSSHLQSLSPWLKTATSTEIHRALFYASESLRISAILLSPIMPEKMSELLDRLGIEKDKRSWNDLGVGNGGMRKGIGEKGGYLFPPVIVAEEESK